MCRNIGSLAATTILALLLTSTVWADIPAPPVNQVLGFRDVFMSDQTEATCRACHDSGVPDRHHMLYGTPTGTFVPYPDTNGDGTKDATFNCLSCHGTTFTVVRDCTVCHQEVQTPRGPSGTVHHSGLTASSGDCKACHGDIVDNRGDGHYIPTYEPSLVTPTSSEGDGLPLNSRNHGAGACNYCHDSDTPEVLGRVIQDNHDLHHYAARAGSAVPDANPPIGAGNNGRCLWCHVSTSPFSTSIKNCEGCHGPDSLHNIQADSPAPGNIGTIVVGAEDAGWGHVGKDVNAGNSDCWGCHGFARMALAPGSGPLIPTVYGANRTVITSGTASTVLIAGAALTNSAGTTDYTSDVVLTSANGTSVTLTPDIMFDEGMLAVTIPVTTTPGNYELRAVKDEFASNPTVLTVVPKVRVKRAAGNTTVTILGNGFGGYARGSGTTVTGRITTVEGTRTRIRVLAGTIVSWTDGRIVARFAAIPNQVTVRSVFGGATAVVARVR